MTSHILSYLLCFLIVNVAAGIGWSRFDRQVRARYKGAVKTLDRKQYPDYD
jgi:hypothetical protein